MSLLLLKTSQKNKHKKNVFKNNPAIYTFQNSHNYDIDSDEDGWVVLGILGGIIGLWWGVIHLLDAFTFDFIIWWAEPFTILPMFLYAMMMEFMQRKNPLHWWPLVWGYKIKLPDSQWGIIHLLDEDELMEKYGGPFNVYIVGNCIQFRRKKDAVVFSLTHS